MHKEFIEHGLKFNIGQVVTHKANKFELVVTEIDAGYDAPYFERIICKYWHPTKEQYVEDKFYPTELEP